MITLIRSLFLLLMALSLLGGCEKKPSGNAIVSINDRTITEGDLNFLASLNPRIVSQLNSEHGRKQIINNLIEQELLYQESKRQSFEQSADVRAKTDFYRRVFVAQALVEHEIETEAKKYYDTHPDEFESLGLSQIFIGFGPKEDSHGHDHGKLHKKSKAKKEQSRDEKEALTLANKIKERLDKGEDFAELAKEYSEDPLTKGKGGDIGLITRNDPRLTRRGMNELLEKAFTMKVGESAGPIRTESGFSLIKLTRGVESQIFDEVKASIAYKIKGDVQKKLIEMLKEKSKITYENASLNAKKENAEKEKESK